MPPSDAVEQQLKNLESHLAQENPVLLPESPDKTPDVAAFEEHASLL